MVQTLKILGIWHWLSWFDLVLSPPTFMFLFYPKSDIIVNGTWMVLSYDMYISVMGYLFEIFLDYDVFLF